MSAVCHKSLVARGVRCSGAEAVGVTAGQVRPMARKVSLDRVGLGGISAKTDKPEPLASTEAADICTEACRELWCAVINQQLKLALWPTTADKPADISAARHWFDSRDFYMVCALAGLDGGWVLRGVRRQFEMAGAA